MSLKIPVVYAHHNIGCAPIYTLAALARLGHETRRLTPEEYFAANPDNYDLFFCQDSGLGIDFRNASPAHLCKTSWWSWDSRFNRVQRNPGDDDMAELVARAGGWVFQAQTPDLERVARERRLERQSWLPIGADPFLWKDEPLEEKLYGMSFVGNCYDGGRAAALNYARDHCGLYWPGPNAVFGEAAARIYRQSWVVFSVPTFFGIPHDVTGERVDIDVTMRYYEAAACGVPVITPKLPDFDRLGFENGFQIYIFQELNEIKDLVSLAKKNMQNSLYSKSIREWVSRKHTYEHRIEEAFRQLRLAGILK